MVAIPEKRLFEFCTSSLGAILLVLLVVVGLAYGLAYFTRRVVNGQLWMRITFLVGDVILLGLTGWATWWVWSVSAASEHWWIISLALLFVPRFRMSNYGRRSIFLD